jgi:hypothetical protein
MPMMAAKLGSETMAFLTRKRVGNKKYLQVVHNYREDGKHRQRVLMHVGPYASLEHAIADWHHYAENKRLFLDVPDESIRRYYAERIEELRALASRYNIPIDESELERVRSLLDGTRWRENESVVRVVS